jgi:hypothetical protein
MFSQLTRYASEFGIQIDNAELDIRTEYDGRGKMMIDDVSPAAQQVTYKWEIESPAVTDRIEEMLMWIDRGCHTLNSLRQPVPVIGRAEVNGKETAFEQRPFAR